MGKINLSLLLLTIFLILSSCTRESEPIYSYAGLDIRLESFCFKKDSYWIFENDSTGLIDSIVVTDIDDYEEEYPSYDGKGFTRQNFIKFYLTNFTTNQTYIDFLYINQIKRNGGGEKGKLGQVIYDVNNNASANYHPGYHYYETLTSFSINGNTFNNVKKTKITASEQSSPEFEFDTFHYFCDSIGIVKKVTVLGNGNFESWSIKRWDVELLNKKP